MARRSTLNSIRHPFLTRIGRTWKTGLVLVFLSLSVWPLPTVTVLLRISCIHPLRYVRRHQERQLNITRWKTSCAVNYPIYQEEYIRNLQISYRRCQGTTDEMMATAVELLRQTGEAGNSLNAMKWAMEIQDAQPEVAESVFDRVWNENGSTSALSMLARNLQGQATGVAFGGGRGFCLQLRKPDVDTCRCRRNRWGGGPSGRSDPGNDAVGKHCFLFSGSGREGPCLSTDCRESELLLLTEREIRCGSVKHQSQRGYVSAPASRCSGMFAP